MDIDILYRSTAFVPDKGGGSQHGQTFAQLSRGVILKLQSDCLLLTENNDIIDLSAGVRDDKKIQIHNNDVADFVSKEEREETTEYSI